MGKGKTNRPRMKRTEKKMQCPLYLGEGEGARTSSQSQRITFSLLESRLDLVA